MAVGFEPVPMQVAEEFTGEGGSPSREGLDRGGVINRMSVSMCLSPGQRRGGRDQVAGEAHHQMLVVERVVGIGCEVDDGAGDGEDLAVVVRLIGQQLRPADDCFRIAGSALPAQMLTEVSERQRPVEDGGVRLFGGRSRREVLRGAGHGP